MAKFNMIEVKTKLDEAAYEKYKDRKMSTGERLAKLFVVAFSLVMLNSCLYSYSPSTVVMILAVVVSLGLVGLRAYHLFHIQKDL